MRSPSLLVLLPSGGVPLGGVAHGAEALREPVHPLVFDLRARWRDEAAAMVVHLDTTAISRRCIGTALEARPVDLGGYRVQFAPGDRRGSRCVDMTYLAADGRFRR